jgi:ribonuclease G
MNPLKVKNSRVLVEGESMATELIINASLPETRIALMEEGEIQEVLIERAQGKGIVGNIYKGRVTRVLPGMQAAFVDIGLEKAAFLYVDDVFVHSHMFDDEEVSQEHHHDNGDSKNNDSKSN